VRPCSASISVAVHADAGVRTDGLPRREAGRYLGNSTLPALQMLGGGVEHGLSLPALQPRGGCAEALGVPRSVAAAMALASLLCCALRLAAFKIPCWPVALCRKTGWEAAALFSVLHRIAVGFPAARVVRACRGSQLRCAERRGVQSA